MCSVLRCVLEDKTKTLEVTKLFSGKKSQHCFVSVFSSHLLWTSSALDVPAGVTQERGHT